MLQLGNWQFESVVNGTMRLDGGAMFGVVPRVLWSKTQDVDAQNRILLATRTLMAHHIPSRRTVLVDTGTGSKWSDADAERYGIESNPAAIELALQAMGADADSVTDVIVTHLHFDHCGGMTDWQDDVGGSVRVRFTNARHWVHREHFKHAGAPTLRDRASFLSVDFAWMGQDERVRFVEGDQPHCDIPELHFELSHGHTPYQLLPVFDLGSGSELFFVGDMAPTSAHILPAWVMAYDIFPLKSVDERVRLLNGCQERDTIIAFPHDVRCGMVRLDVSGTKPKIGEVLSP
jgi:glyoxylase-like metal-dependent hydrolase (beta-lactamase superfamily II)